METSGPVPGKEGVNSGRRWIDMLLGIGVIGSIASFVYPAIRYVIPPPQSEAEAESVTAAKVGQLKGNSGMVFRFGSEPAILIHTPQGQYRAFSAVCTHLGCTVQYDAQQQQIWCPCHNGRYNLMGRNVSGPPPRPLTSYSVHIQGDDIVVARNA